MFNGFQVQSHQGKYSVEFGEIDHLLIDAMNLENTHVVVDQKILALYSEKLKKLLSQSQSVLVIEAVEANKSLEQTPRYVHHIVANKLRRNHRLIAIGGGIIQDITCFLAANMLRGVEWWFVPTTLLSQADSCIGSKSSINCGDSKNILGTFTPPKQVFIDVNFLKTLDIQAIRSGVGEMLKVHAIDGPASFDQIAQNYQSLFHDEKVLIQYIQRSLEIKKRIIEQDEFDRNIRQVMNYGHSFGHALESATNYKIPHGIAVTIGMDMANYVAMRAGLTTEEHYSRMHGVLCENYIDFAQEEIPMASFLSAIAKDKKNIGNTHLSLILPNQDGLIAKTSLPVDSTFEQCCLDYLMKERFSVSGVMTAIV